MTNERLILLHEKAVELLEKIDEARKELFEMEAKKLDQENNDGHADAELRFDILTQRRTVEKLRHSYNKTIKQITL